MSEAVPPINPVTCNECGQVAPNNYPINPRSGSLCPKSRWCVPCFETLAARSARQFCENTIRPAGYSPLHVSMMDDRGAP